MNFEKLYQKNYKLLMVLPLIFFLISCFFIIKTIKVEGTPIYRDISLKGGLSAVIYTNSSLSDVELENFLHSKFPNYEVSVSEIEEGGKVAGYVIDTNIPEDQLKKVIAEKFDNYEYSSNYISPSLSESFFREAMWILFISFILMAAVIFFYFREKVPCFAVVLSAIFDIICTVGVLDMLKVKLSVAGIGALLMLIGYSIDTDILLTNRLVKEPGKEYIRKIYDAFKTGMTMSTTTMVAALIAFLLSTSQVIKEISLIILIGLLVDIISTWIQNAGLLFWWLEKKNA